MDSKYTSVGVENNHKVNGLKRKHVVENIKVKKIKLSHDSRGVANNIKVETNTNGHNNIKENNIIKEPIQDLQEARRQLPVYMVRHRYVFNFFSSTLRITNFFLCYIIITLLNL